MNVSAHTHLFWITSRAAGITALVLASATVTVGLVMSGRLVKGSNPERRALHEVLSLSVLVAIALHGLILVGDKYLHPGLTGVLVPFVSKYERGWTTLGIIAGWSLIALGLSYYLRKRIGAARWKLIHRFTLLAWAAAVVHSVTEGTDAGTAWFIALVVISTAPALLALGVRMQRSLT